MRSLRIGSRAVPQREREAQPLRGVRDAREPVLAPAVGLRARLVVGERVPRVAVRASRPRAPCPTGVPRGRDPTLSTAQSRFWPPRAVCALASHLRTLSDSRVMRRLLFLVVLLVLGLPAVAEAKTIKIYVLRGEALDVRQAPGRGRPRGRDQGAAAGHHGRRAQEGLRQRDPERRHAHVGQGRRREGRGRALEQLRRRRRLLPRARRAGGLHGDRRRPDVEEVEIRGRTFTRADFAPPEEYAAPKPPTKKPARAEGPGGRPDQALAARLPARGRGHRQVGLPLPAGRARLPVVGEPGARRDRGRR